MELTQKPVWNTQPKVGEQVELYPEFQEFQEVVPIEVVKLPSVTNVEKVECLPPYTLGEDGIEE